MKKLVIYFTLLTAFLLFETCKKYPEGGYENRGPKMLLKHGGVWYLDKYEVNGIDSTNLINYNGSENYKKIVCIVGSKYSNTILAQKYPIDSYLLRFHNNNKVVEFYEDCSTGLIGAICYTSLYTGCYRTLFAPECGNTVWEIIKLTKTEMRIKCVKNNSYYLILKSKN